MEPTEFLEKIYAESMELVGSDDTIKSDLDNVIKNHLFEILDRSESAKAVITVILTSAAYKYLNSLFCSNYFQNLQYTVNLLNLWLNPPNLH